MVSLVTSLLLKRKKPSEKLNSAKKKKTAFGPLAQVVSVKSLDHFDKSILLTVFQFLLPSELTSVSQTCTSVAPIASDDKLWKAPFLSLTVDWTRLKTFSLQGKAALRCPITKSFKRCYGICRLWCCFYCGNPVPTDLEGVGNTTAFKRFGHKVCRLCIGKGLLSYQETLTRYTTLSAEQLQTLPYLGPNPSKGLFDRSLVESFIAGTLNSRFLRQQDEDEDLKYPTSSESNVIDFSNSIFDSLKELTEESNDKNSSSSSSSSSSSTSNTTTTSTTSTNTITASPQPHQVAFQTLHNKPKKLTYSSTNTISPKNGRLPPFSPTPSTTVYPANHHGLQTRQGFLSSQVVVSPLAASPAGQRRHPFPQQQHQQPLQQQRLLSPMNQPRPQQQQPLVPRRPQPSAIQALKSLPPLPQQQRPLIVHGGPSRNTVRPSQQTIPSSPSQLLNIRARPIGGGIGAPRPLQQQQLPNGLAVQQQLLQNRRHPPLVVPLPSSQSIPPPTTKAPLPPPHQLLLQKQQQRNRVQVPQLNFQSPTSRPSQQQQQLRTNLPPQQSPQRPPPLPHPKPHPLQIIQKDQFPSQNHSGSTVVLPGRPLASPLRIHPSPTTPQQQQQQPQVNGRSMSLSSPARVVPPPQLPQLRPSTQPQLQVSLTNKIQHPQILRPSRSQLLLEAGSKHPHRLLPPNNIGGSPRAIPLPQASPPPQLIASKRPILRPQPHSLAPRPIIHSPIPPSQQPRPRPNLTPPILNIPSTPPQRPILSKPILPIVAANRPSPRPLNTHQGPSMLSPQGIRLPPRGGPTTISQPLSLNRNRNYSVGR